MGFFLKKNSLKFQIFNRKSLQNLMKVLMVGDWLIPGLEFFFWICKGFSFRFSWHGRPYVSPKKPPRTILTLMIRAVWQKLCSTQSKGNGRNFSTNPYPSQSLPRERVCNINYPEKNPIRVGTANGTKKDSWETCVIFQREYPMVLFSVGMKMETNCTKGTTKEAGNTDFLRSGRKTCQK